MTAKKFCLVLGAAVLLAPLAAAAEGARLGINFVPMPYGSLTASAGGTDFSRDTAFAVGVMPTIDYRAHPNFFVGIGPQYTFNVKGENDTGSAATELDVMLRVGGQAAVLESLQVYGYVSPGYSILMLPSDSPLDDPMGLMCGFHGGGMLHIDSTLFLNAQIGYQLGFQQVTIAGTDTDLKSNFFQVGLGAGVHL